MTTKLLNCRQARWAKFLSKFNFLISYKPGKKSGKPDILTKKPHNIPQGVDDTCQQYQLQTLLTQDQLDNKVKKAQGTKLCTNTIGIEENNAIVDEADEVNKNNENIVNVQNYTDANNLATHSQHSANLLALE